MADDDDTDDSQKTEDPTPRKLEEAKKRGEVVHSKEVNNWVILLAATIFTITAAPNMLVEVKDLFKNFMAQSHSYPTDKIGLSLVIKDLFTSAGMIVVVPILFVALAGALSAFAQTGPLFTIDPIKPNISKLSLVKGFERLFSARSVMEFVKGIIKITLVSVAVIFTTIPYFESVEHFVGQEIGPALMEMHFILIKMLVAILSVLFFLAVMDYIFQRHEYMKKMKMSLQEIKDEYKQTEGDPMVKGKLRQLREQKARQRMMQSVPEADVVITNPTHYAIALKYDMQAMQAPIMLAKGTDDLAGRIKELAKEHDIPIVENAPLARALFDSMEIEEVIPAEHFQAVAEIISYVFKLKGKK